MEVSNNSAGDDITLHIKVKLSCIICRKRSVGIAASYTLDGRDSVPDKENKFLFHNF
jgi:hypothetical protein